MAVVLVGDEIGPPLVLEGLVSQDVETVCSAARRLAWTSASSRPHASLPSMIQWSVGVEGNEAAGGTFSDRCSGFASSSWWSHFHHLMFGETVKCFASWWSPTTNRRLNFNERLEPAVELAVDVQRP